MTITSIVLAVLLMLPGQATPIHSERLSKVVITSANGTEHIPFRASLVQPSGTQRLRLTTPYTFDPDTVVFVLVVFADSTDASLDGTVSFVNGPLRCSGSGHSLVFYSMSASQVGVVAH